MGDTQLDDSLKVESELEEILNRVVDWNSLPTNHFVRAFNLGKLGKNVGWGTGMYLKNVDKHLHGTHRGRYYLIGADSGVGKTTYSDFKYLMCVYEWAKKNNKKFYCYYYSFELSKLEKIARWVALYCYIKFEKVFTSDYILGRIDGRIVSEEDTKYIMLGYAYVEEMLKCVLVIEDAVHPTRIFNDIVHHHYDHPSHGKIIYGLAMKGKKYGPMLGWTPASKEEEEAMVMVFIDHMALLHSEQGLDTKGTMDLMSKYTVALRNLFGLTAVYIQQFSTDLQSTNRSIRKMSDKVIAPQRLDFGDSKYTYRDADVVLGLINPVQFEIDDYYGYEVDNLNGYMIAAHIMKNRYGASFRMIPLLINPLSGFFFDLPLETADIVMEPFYEKAKEIAKWQSHFQSKQ